MYVSPAVVQHVSDRVLTRAFADLERAGIPLAAVLDPAKRATCLRAIGIGLKTYERLQEAACIAAEVQPKPKRGGAGRGQGRKPLATGEETVSVTLKLTAGQRAKLAHLGGGKWVRKQIDDAIEWRVEIVDLTSDTASLTMPE